MNKSIDQIQSITNVVGGMVSGFKSISESNMHPIIKIVGHSVMSMAANREIERIVRSETSICIGPGELIVPNKNFNEVIYRMDPNRKCYNAKQSMTLNQFKKFKRRNTE